jgi:hypothetical protein
MPATARRFGGVGLSVGHDAADERAERKRQVEKVGDAERPDDQALAPERGSEVRGR